MIIKRKLRIVELYAGTGRSVEPFRQWKQVDEPTLVDYNLYAADVYNNNYPKTPYILANLASVNAKEILKLSENKIDILLGCPPCQGYSDNGSRNPDDPRNKHVSRFAYYAEKAKPLVIAMENVPLLAESLMFKKFVERMERAGYLWTASVVNAALWGSCQSRQRLIYVAYRKDLGVTPCFPQPTHGTKEQKYFSYRFMKPCSIDDDRVGMLGEAPGARRAARFLPSSVMGSYGTLPIPTVGKVISGLPKAGSKAGLDLNHYPWAHTEKTLSRMKDVPEGGRWTGAAGYYSQTYGRLHRRGLARTITGYLANAGSGRFWHPTENRAITLREAARIQGFPDSFSFLNKQSEDCVLVGNALDSALARLTYNMVRPALE